MIKDSSKLVNGQRLKIDIDQVKDRLPIRLIKQINDDPYGILVGYKMVDGNQFGLALQLANDQRAWFFEHELSEEE